MTSRILRADARVGEVGGLELQRPERRRAPLLDHRRRRPLDEAAQVVAEARRDGAPGAALEALDEAPDEPHAVLERKPRVALAPVGAGRQAHVAAGDAQRRDAAGRGREPARRAQGVQHRQAQGGHDRRRPEVALDPLEDRRERGELAGRVEVEQLVGERLAALEDGEPVDERLARVARVAVEGELQVVRVERRLALLAAPELVPADGAAVVLAGRLRPDAACRRHRWRRRSR